MKAYDKKRAILFFLDDLNIRHFFQEMPSIREVETLLCLAKSYQHRSAAKKMGVKLKTLEKNMASIKDRLIAPEMLGHLIEAIQDTI